jgi:hypothetical protein
MKAFGLNGEEVKLHNEELRIKSPHDIIFGGRMRWTGYVIQIGKRGTGRVSVGQPGRKRPLVWPGHVWKIILKYCVNGMGRRGLD